MTISHTCDLGLLFRYLTFLLRVVYDMHQCFVGSVRVFSYFGFILVMCLLEAPPVLAKHEFPTPAI